MQSCKISLYKSCTHMDRSPLLYVYVGLSVLDLGPMYATDRHTSDRETSDKSIT